MQIMLVALSSSPVVSRSRGTDLEMGSPKTRTADKLTRTREWWLAGWLACFVLDIRDIHNNKYIKSGT